MEYNRLNLDLIKSAIEEYVPAQTRNIKMYTNAYGVDQFNEVLDSEIYGGSYRIYFGKKLPRFMKKLKRIGKSYYTKRYYKTILNGK